MAARLDLDRLCKLLPLLGSDQPGEVLGAAAAIRRTLAAAGMDLNDWAEATRTGVLRQAAAGVEEVKRRAAQDAQRFGFGSSPGWETPPREEFHDRPQKPDWSRVRAVNDGERLAAMIGREGWRPKDEAFLDSLARWVAAGRNLTPKQRDWFEGLWQKFEKEGQA